MLPAYDEWGAACKNALSVVTDGYAEQLDLDIPTWALIGVPGNNKFRRHNILTGELLSPILIPFAHFTSARRQYRELYPTLVHQPNNGPSYFLCGNAYYCGGYISSAPLAIYEEKKMANGHTTFSYAPYPSCPQSSQGRPQRHMVHRPNIRRNR